MGRHPKKQLISELRKVLKAISKTSGELKGRFFKEFEKCQCVFDAAEDHTLSVLERTIKTAKDIQTKVGKIKGKVEQVEQVKQVKQVEIPQHLRNAMVVGYTNEVAIDNKRVWPFKPLYTQEGLYTKGVFDSKLVELVTDVVKLPLEL